MQSDLNSSSPDSFLTRHRKWVWITAAISLVVIVSLTWIVVRPNSASAGAPEGVYWICKPGGHHFHVSTRDLNDFQAKHYGEPYPCPQCKSTDLIPAIKCEKCGEYYPIVRGKTEPCPKCGTVPKAPE